MSTFVIAGPLVDNRRMSMVFVLDEPGIRPKNLKLTADTPAGDIISKPRDRGARPAKEGENSQNVPRRATQFGPHAGPILTKEDIQRQQTCPHDVWSRVRPFRQAQSNCHREPQQAKRATSGWAFEQSALREVLRQ
ncbi:hypothetical protein GCM10011400_08470 [Paraburkholderia caffeinilytica]|uniref:Uncharacterized protein n=1 Tax=Paraburkholderia caffeinilytica TaxID=1761016 RepID=A0ABQ1LH24_9BURK|nr:hypothetical protein GCM10011400_08470 [Paraburkholderia caffeinilytica]